MPEHEFYRYSDTSATIIDAWVNGSASQHYHEWVQECERQYRLQEQMQQEAEEQRAEMKRYPLFFWRELCEPILNLKTGKLI